MKDLTIIIVAFNSATIIKNCLSKLNFDKYDVVVVDNASTDDTVKIVEQNFPKTKIIKSEKNIGYGRGNNLALREVKTEFSLVLNPDAFIEEAAIEAIILEMKNNSKIAISAPLLLENIEDKQELKNKINKINKDLSGKKIRYYENYKDLFYTNFLSGAIIFLNMKIIREIGYFDENIFLFYEDDEICYRARKSGFLCVLFIEKFAQHLVGKSSKSTIRGSYRKCWHLKGWSKLYFIRMKKGLFYSKIYSCFNILKYLTKIFGYLVKLNFVKIVESFGAISGSFCFLVGMKAFSKKGPRG